MSAHRRSSFPRIIAATCFLFSLVGPAMAQSVPESPVERAVTLAVMEAITKAGVDLRAVPLRAITTADRIVYLTGPVNNPQAIKTAITAATGAAPGYRVITDITADHARNRPDK